MAILTVITKTGDEVALPAPVQITAGNEIIWSSNTGRSSTGKMVGDVIAEKQTLTVTWGILTSAQFNLIKANLKAGFFILNVNVDGTPVSLSRYRGTLTSEPMGQLGDGKYYYRSASTDIVQQ